MLRENGEIDQKEKLADLHFTFIGNFVRNSGNISGSYQGTDA